jgi:hypothetical protein
MGIAGEGEGGIGEREDEAAVAQIMAVTVIASRARPGPTSRSSMPRPWLAASSDHMASALRRAISWASRVMPSSR